MITLDPANDQAVLISSDHFPSRRGPPVRSSGREKSAATEVVIGTVLVLAMVAGGIYFAVHPDQGTVDRWFSMVETSGKSPWYTAVVWLRFPPVIIAGAIAAAAVCRRRDPARAWACLIGPPLALATCELAVKPLVGRHLGAAFSYPSGSTVGAAALATAAALAAPAGWRVAAIVLATLYASWMATAVVALGWHYPTDSLAGVAYGIGVMLLADGLAWYVADHLRPRSLRRRSAGADPGAERTTRPPAA